MYDVTSTNYHKYPSTLIIKHMNVFARVIIHDVYIQFYPIQEIYRIKIKVITMTIS